MMTLIERIRNHRSSLFLKNIARQEKVDIAELKENIKTGRVVAPFNKNHCSSKPCGIGKGLRTKINTNLGTSTDNTEITDELKKLKIALDYGTDTVMDLSVGGNLAAIRRLILKNSSVPVGTVPIYEAAVEAQRRNKNFLEMEIGDILKTILDQARDGVDFFTLHCGVTRKTLSPLKKGTRILGIVSRGGAILSRWMQARKEENPLFSHFDKIIEICHEFDITISLGDGLRPGSIADSTDHAQVAELKVLGKLAQKALRAGVQCMIEGPGHIPLQDIAPNIKLQKRLCRGAPFYVLGPLVTDVAPGYDHIVGAIGGAVAGSLGADFLCIVSPAEHLRHPSVEDIKEAVISSRIAAHAADLAKGYPQLAAWDRKISKARKARDWEAQTKLALDPEKVKRYRSSSRPLIKDTCTMCGDYCSIKLGEEVFN